MNDENVFLRIYFKYKIIHAEEKSQIDAFRSSTFEMSYEFER